MLNVKFTVVNTKVCHIYYKKPTGHLFASQTIFVKWLFFRQTALKTQRALKVLAQKTLFLSYLCSLFRVPVKKAQRKNLVHIIY